MGGPLIPLTAALGFVVLSVLIGLAARVDLLAFLAAIFWPVVLAIGLTLSVVLVGLWVGWPLMWATIGVERTDAFDATSRCYAYAFQKPIRLICYLFLAIVLGHLGGLLIHAAADLAVWMSEWAIGLGAGSERIDYLTHKGDPLTGHAILTAAAIRTWKSFLFQAADAFSLSYLWSAAVGVYLLLRKAVDDTELDEVALDDAVDAAEEGDVSAEGPLDQPEQA